MLTRAPSTPSLPKTDAGYLEAIEQALREMDTVRKSMKKPDGELRRLRDANRRNLDETWAAIQRVQATV
jgi:hypothetical protein